MDKPLKFILKKTAEFSGWYQSVGMIDRVKIDARLDNMIDGDFSNSRNLQEGLFETKWKNGMRVYYSRKRIADADVVVLWGGFKGTQKRDIPKARGIKRRYENAYTEKAGE